MLGDISNPAGVMARDIDPAIAGSVQLHPFVKLAIAYVGIVAGLAVVGLVFYVIASRGKLSAADLLSSRRTT